MHLLAVMMLLGAFLLLSGKLYLATTLIISDAEKAQSVMTQLDLVMSRLRRDVWGAASLTAADPSTLILRQHDGATVTWRMLPDESALTRQAGHVRDDTLASRFVDLPVTLTFVADGSALLVNVYEIDADQPAQFTLVSQLASVAQPAP